MNRIKRVSLQILEKYKDRFTTDFETNKELLNSIAIFRSKEFRNEVAGYITGYMRGSKDHKVIEDEIAHKEF